MITSGALCGGGGAAAAADLVVRVRFAFAFAFESWAFGLSFALVLARLLGHIDAGRLLDDSLWVDSPWPGFELLHWREDF